jgi:predicted small lipoprotein YifL
MHAFQEKRVYLMRTFAALFFILMVLSGCGRKGHLIYPELTAPAAPTTVIVRQAGQAVRLSMVLPAKDQAGRRLGNLGGVTVFKRAGTMAQGPICSACTEGFTLFRKLYLDVLLPESGVQRFGSQLMLLDSDVRIGGEYSYTVTPFTKDYQDGLTSPPVTAGMVPPPSPPKLKAESLPTEIRLTFSSTLPLTGKFMGYNLYRAQKGELLPFAPLVKEPIRATSFVDIGLDRNLNYVYAARTVVQMPGGNLVESDLSSEVAAQLTNE